MPGTWPPCRPGMWWRCTPGRLSRASWASARHRKSAPSATPVTIRHDDGTQAHSAHRKSGPFRVRTTERVHAGPILAEAGNSGSPFGRHVHVHGTRDPRITAPRVPSFLRRRSAVHRGEDFGPGRRGPAPAVAGGSGLFSRVAAAGAGSEAHRAAQRAAGLKGREVGVRASPRVAAGPVDAGRGPHERGAVPEPGTGRVSARKVWGEAGI